MLSLRYKSLLAVALPLMATSFIQSVVLLTDTAFLARWDTMAFDASGNAGLIYITLYMCLVGFGDGSQIIQAKKIGEQNGTALKSILQHTYFINILLGFLLAIFAFTCIRPFLNSYAHNLEIASLQSDFLETRIWGLPFVAITLSTNAYFSAKGQTWKVLISAVLTASSNILMDYSLIFGHFGMPAMGLRGAAIASTLADALGAVGSLWILAKSKKDLLEKTKSKLKFNANILKELFTLSGPLVFQGVVALSTWTLFFTWIEQKSTFDLTVSQNIRAVYFIAFIPVFGFSGTTRTYISQYLGANQKERIPQIQRRLSLLIILSLITLLHGAVLYPETIIRWINPAEQYVTKSASILSLVSGSILIYGIGSIFFQTINGLGKTKITFRIEIVAVALYLLCAYSFIKIWKWDIWWIWLVEYIYFGTLAILSIGYLIFDKQSKTSLITRK